MMFCASDERSCAARPHQPGPHRPLVSAIPASGIPVSHRIYKGTRWQRAFAATSRILALRIQGSPDRLRTWPHLGNLRGRCATPPSRLPSRRHGAWQNYCAPRSKKPVYVSKVRIERRSGPLRLAQLPGESQPIAFSVHGAIAEHYGLDPAKLPESHASTLDYVVAALGG